MRSDSNISFSLLLLNAKDFSFALFFFLAIKYIRSWLVMERETTEMDNTRLDSGLKLMKAQIDHHFLFNTFNNIYSLSIVDPVKTRSAIKKLWGLLDFLVNEIDSEETGIDRELRLIKDYVDLEKLRYGERLEFEFHIDENIRNFRIPPLIFFPFIENCFKHGSAIDPGNPWIKINVLEMKDRIRFIARNSHKSQGENEAHKSKFNSIEVVKKRLKYFFPGRYFLKIKKKENEYFVQLDLMI